MEESELGGLVDVAPSDPPATAPCIYQQQASICPTTLYRPGTRTLSEGELPSTSTNKCQEEKRKSQLIRIAARTKWRKTVGRTRSDENKARIAAVTVLNAYPLCPGNDEARDHRRRRISLEISAGKRSRKRQTGPNIQPKLTGYFVR